MGYQGALVPPRSRAYKIRDVLAREGVREHLGGLVGLKIEAWDRVEQSVALIHDRGRAPSFHTDSAEGIQRMNQEAAKRSPRAALGITLDGG